MSKLGIYYTQRGRPVDIVSLAKKNENRIALGNAHMNGRGDILGRGGKVIETREEQLAKYYEGNKARTTSATVNLKEESIQDVEKELKKVQEETFVRAKPKAKKPVYTDITEAEKEELSKKGE